MSDNVHYLPPRSDRIAWMPRWTTPDPKTATWSTAAKVLLFELQNAQWTMESLPDDIAQLRALVGRFTDRQWRAAWKRVEREFPVCADGRRRNQHLCQLYDLVEEIEALRRRLGE